MPTGGGATPDRTPGPPRPCLVVVKGLDEGLAFDLSDRGKSEWRVGRRRGCEIALDFDPSISAENSLVRWDGRVHSIEDLAESKNGTSINFRRLAKHAPTALAHGDIVGVGRTLLVYWE